MGSSYQGGKREGARTTHDKKAPTGLGKKEGNIPAEETGTRSEVPKKGPRECVRSRMEIVE